MNSKLILLAILIILVLIYNSSQIQQEFFWQKTIRDNTKEGYSSFIESWPNSKHIDEARSRWDESCWREANAANTISGFENYIQNNNAGKYVKLAREKIENKSWENSIIENNIRSYKNFLTQYPSGRFTSEAISNIRKLEQDDSPFLEAKKKGTENSLQTFMDNYPGHARENYVKSILRDMEGRNIVDLINEGKIEAKVEGSGISSVTLKLKPKIEFKINVIIPAGVFFTSIQGSAQNMVATKRISIELEPELDVELEEQWTTVSVPAACANMHKAVPGLGNRFNIENSSNQEELEKVLPILEKEGEPYEVKQAAIWIITDDADYEGLGTLVSRPAYMAFGGTRTINEYEAAKAMWLIDKSGIDITSKAIWNDRKNILEELTNNELRVWLQEKDS